MYRRYRLKRNGLSTDARSKRAGIERSTGRDRARPARWTSIAIALWIVAGEATATLPAPVEAAVRASGLPAESTAIFVQEVSTAQPLVAVNAERGMLTASVIKVLTTYAGL